MAARFLPLLLGAWRLWGGGQSNGERCSIRERSRYSIKISAESQWHCDYTRGHKLGERTRRYRFEFPSGGRNFVSPMKTTTSFPSSHPSNRFLPFFSRRGGDGINRQSDGLLASQWKAARHPWRQGLIMLLLLSSGISLLVCPITCYLTTDSIFR